MKLEEILKNVDHRWQKEFLTFIDTGEGSNEFLTYLDNDPQGQKAVDLAFNAQAKAFEGLAEEFRKAPSSNIEAKIEPTAVASESLTQAVENIARLPHEQQLEAVRNALSSLNDEQQKTAYSVAQKFETVLSSHG
jgi:hypothetical protein